jgi:O-antigen ligase
MKNIAKWVALGALFLIPFLSLYVSNGMYFPFITGKNFLFRALVEIAFAAWLVLAICDKRYRPRFSWTLVWYKTFVVWLVIVGLFFAVNAHKAFWSNYERMDGGITLIHLYILMVVMAGVLSTENLWRKWWLTFIAANALVCVNGIFQLMGAAQIHQGSTRIDASIGNAEYFAGYLLFSIAVTVWQAFETRDRKQSWLRYGLFLLAIIQVILLFFTGTRGTLIGLVAGAFVGSILWAIESGKKGRKVAGTIIAILVLLVGGLFVARDTSFVKGNENINRLASTFQLKEALGPRLTIWGMAIEGIKEKPITGWGQEGYNYIFNKYYEPSLYAQEPWFDRAHNMFLDWAVAGGIPALMLFLLVLITSAWALYRAPVSQFERVFLLSALAAYAVQGLAVFDNLFTYIPFVAILATAHMASSRPIKLMERAGEINDTRLDTLIAPGALVAGLLLVWFVNIPSVLASANLIDGLTPSNATEARLNYFRAAVDNGGLAHQEIAEQLLSFASQAAASQNVPQDLKQRIVDFAGAEMNKELERAPLDARLHLQYALFYRSIGAYKEAQQESGVAHTLSPKKQSIILEQGIEAFQQKDYAKAKEYFTQAYEINKDYTEPVSYIAATDIVSRDVPAAKALLQQTFGTTSVNHQMLILAYYQIGDWDDLVDVVRARANETHDVDDQFQLAAAYSQAGRREEAIATVKAAITEHPDAADQGAALLKQLGAK